MIQIRKWALLWIVVIVAAAAGLSALPAHAAPSDDSRTISEALHNNEKNDTEADKPSKRTTITEKEPEQVEADLMEERSLFAVFFQLIVALAVVIGLMYLLVKILNKRTKTFQAHQTMQNLGGVPLGQHKSIQLVKVGERLLVVGVGESIQLLTEIMNEEEINQLIERKQAPGESWGRQGFSFFDRFKQAGASNKNGKQDSFQDLFREQLHDLKKTRKKARQHLKEYDS